jgi:hypothetical protein
MNKQLGGMINVQPYTNLNECSNANFVANLYAPLDRDLRVSLWIQMLVPITSAQYTNIHLQLDQQLARRLKK